VWFTGLHLNDLYVGNLRQMLEALVERLGFQPPDAGQALPGVSGDGAFSPPGFGSETTFTRLSAWSTDMIQLIAAKPLASGERELSLTTPLNSIFGVIPGVLPWLGERPGKTHRVTTHLAGEEMVALVRYWDANDVPYLLTDPCDAVPFPAVFPGWSGDPIRFLPERVVVPWEWGGPALFDVYEGADRDHWLEVLAAAGDMELPAPAIPEGAPPEGTLLKVLARSFIVDDIDRELEVLRRNMDLTPGPDELSDETFDDCRVARIAPRGYRDPRTVGAAFELVQARSQLGDLGTFAATFGAGPYAIRLGTDSLEACRAELDRRGTRSWLVDEPAGVRRALVDPAQLYGVRLEIEEL
jgi:hypothetical protein